LNPLKLAGQCGKLKCCLNYELDSYQDALKEFPEIDNRRLATEKGFAFHQKTDIFKRVIWWSYTSEPDVFIPLSIARTKEIFKLNAENIKPADLLEPKQFKELEIVKQPDYENVVGQDSLTRFDSLKKKNNNNKPKHNNNNRKPNPNQKPQAEGTKNNAEVKERPIQQHKPQNPNQNKSQNPNQNKQQNNGPLKQPPQKNAQQGQGPKPQHKKPVHNHKPKPKPDGNSNA
jgi:hypothetical protein